jgi:hypothetical protein
VDGAWSSCFITDVTTKSLPGKQPGLRAQAEGEPEECPESYDQCDPYCNWVEDEPDEDLEVPDNFVATPDGLTIVATGTGGCTTLTLEPSDDEIEVTGLSPLAVSGDITFDLIALPAGCVASPFATTWAIDAIDRATISGTTDQDGLLELALPVGGPISVTAYAAGLSATATIDVRVNVLSAPTTSVAGSHVNANTSQINAFGTRTSPNAGTVDSTASFLYPYENTYFPLALPAPVVQYLYSTSTPNSAVKVSLRYPVGRAATDADFNYSFIVAENNIVSRTAGAASHSLDPQIILPEVAWDYFEETARGEDAEIIVQRRRGNATTGTLERELRRTIHFVDGQLKGTVYYNSYSSPQGGNTGAVLKIAPGATSPTLAVQPNGQCTVCHTVNTDGTRLIANGRTATTPSVRFNISNRFRLDGTPVASDYPEKEFTWNTSSDTENTTGDRFTFGAPWKTGNLYMTHSGITGGDQNWRASPDYMKFYRVAATPTDVSVTNLPTNVIGVTPRFSPDGTRLAFGFWGGSSINGLSSDASKHTLAVSEFTCSSPPCNDNSTGFRVENTKNVTPGFTDVAVWPSFTPDSKSVVYQRQLRTSRHASNSGVLLNWWGNSDINTTTGALAELWMSDVPTSGAATPTRLDSLNGVNLPQKSRTVADTTYPLYTYPVARYDLDRYSGSGAGTIYLSGTTALTGTYLCIRISASGAPGTARFTWKTTTSATCGTGTYSGNIDTETTPVLTTSGLYANFSGNFTSSAVYRAYIGAVTVSGTPSGGPWDLRIKISGTGNRGTATYQYSTNGGTTWSASAVTAATVDLGTGASATGLRATFANINYLSTSWAYGAFVSHYHQDGAKFTINQPDSCTNSGTADAVYDNQLNYLPYVAPVQAGGFNWVMFTSRRMYGNIAYDDPWDAEAKNESGSPYACSSGVPPAKKLWVSAVDSTFTPGTDPSHPAFYFPGQELAAGNSDAYWVSTACVAENGSCLTSDDCCGGSGASPTTACKVTDSSVFPPTRQCRLLTECSDIGEACTTTDDCCSGSCPAGGGACVFFSPPKFEEQVYEREYLAECPFGTHPAWRYFEWQATVPDGARLDFEVQTKLDEDSDYAPASPIGIGSTDETTPANSWQRSDTTVDAALQAEDLASLPYLKLRITFVPTPDGDFPPVLNNWRQIYDCLPAE